MGRPRARSREESSTWPRSENQQGRKPGRHLGRAHERRTHRRASNAGGVGSELVGAGSPRPSLGRKQSQGGETPPLHEALMATAEAIGLIETKGIVTAVEALDAALK